MQITLHYFGQLRQFTGKETESMDVSEGVELDAILQQAADTYDDNFRKAILKEDGSIRPSLMVLVNEEPVNRNEAATLSDGDQIKLITPIAGG